MLEKIKRGLKTHIFRGEKLKEINKVEGHFGLNEGRLLFKIVRSLKDNSVIVEIGAFKGKSTCFIAAGIGSRPMQFFTIDTWYNDKIEEERKDVFPEFLANIKPYKDKIEPLRGYSYDVRKTWPEERKIDFLWIDGDHSYEGVKRDIQDWLPLVKKDSFICFHDYRDAPGVRCAVDEIAREDRIRFVRTEGCIYAAKLN